jgi:hypothetical protein
MSTAAASLPNISVQADAGGAPVAKPSRSHGQSGFSRVFHEILDIINPLQHIPIVSTIYRHLTGDTIDPVAKVAGGALFGGMIGLGLSVADVAVEEATGKDVGDHVWAMFDHASGKADKPTAVAAAPAAAKTRTAQADDRVWFPAFPAGAIHPAALSYPTSMTAKPATADSASAAVTRTATTQDTATPASGPQAQAQTKTTTAGAVPQMDQATFDALVRSFGNKAVAGITPAAPDNRERGPRDAAGQPTDTLGATSTRRAPTRAAQGAPGAWSNPNLNAARNGYAGALKAMEAALDRYQAQGGRIPPPPAMLPGRPAI